MLDTFIIDGYSVRTQEIVCKVRSFRAVDPHYFFPDPDRAAFMNADPDPAPISMRIRIQFKKLEFSSVAEPKLFISGSRSQIISAPPAPQHWSFL